MGFLIRAIQSETEKAAVFDLLRAEFEVRPSAGEAYVELLRDLLERDPSVTDACSFVAVDGSRVLGHALMAPRRLRLGQQTCDAILIGFVVVAPDARRQGIGSALIEELEAAAATGGSAVSVLAGDASFYGRMGYVDGYEGLEVTTTVPGGNAKGEISLSELRVGDAASLARLSEAETDQGAVVRDAAAWRWLIETRHPARLAARNERIVGRLTESDHWLALREGSKLLGAMRVAGCGDSAIVYDAMVVACDAGDLVREARTYAAREGFRSLVFRVSPHSALGQAAGLSRTGAGSDGQMLVKVIDWENVFAVVA